MNTIISHSLIALAAGLIGGLSSSFFSSEPKNSIRLISSQETLGNSIDAQTYAPEDIQWQLQDLQQQVKTLNNKLSKLVDQQEGVSTFTNSETVPSSEIDNRENIINSGINAYVADDILFRIEQQNTRRLELESIIQTSELSERREYSKELRELLNNKITLRSEMGDDAFDQYLFLNSQNNRVKVSSIKPGSTAESAGIMPNDVILYYDNHKILSSTDIKLASANAEISSNTIVVINRDGEEFSITLPGGILDIEFEPLLVDPDLGH